MAWVNPKKMPEQHGIHSIDFLRLDGGLNLSEAEVRLKANESPCMENLLWQDGVLRSRPGIQRITIRTDGTGTAGDTDTISTGVVYACTDRPFYKSYVLHLGTKLYLWDGGTQDGAINLRQIPSSISGAAYTVAQNPGTFFRYGSCLYYKNRGGFFEINCNVEDWLLTEPIATLESRDEEDDAEYTVSSVLDNAVVPTILLNVNPATGAGDLYQPENRLTAKKRVLYTPAEEELPEAVSAGEDDEEDEQGTPIATPEPVAVYHLPVHPVDGVEEVSVDGVVLSGTGASPDYTVDLNAGTVTFAAGHIPAVGDVPVPNRVSITYRKGGADFNRGRDAVMQCTAGDVIGTGTELAIVLGGCPAQPNAVFWNGNTDTGLTPYYWPYPNYNLVGDIQDPVTGFGRQYGDFIVFKERSVGKLSASIATVDGRDTLSLTYTQVNDHVGCDLPATIQTIDNNLVFANSEGGVYRIQNTSPAYENGIVCLSRKVNGNGSLTGGTSSGTGTGGTSGTSGTSGTGSEVTRGLLYALREARGAQPENRRRALALDDGQRYLLAVDGQVWAWDYTISGHDNPAWFPLPGFPVNLSALIRGDGFVFGFTQSERAFRLTPGVYTDDALSGSGTGSGTGDGTGDGIAIRRVYTFPLRDCGGLDRVKDILTAIFSMAGDSPQRAELTYRTDYETREDLTPLRSAARSGTSGTGTSGGTGNAIPAVFRRRPMCRHVRHFGMTLETTAAADMAILSAQVQFRLLGRDR